MQLNLQDILNTLKQKLDQSEHYCL